MKRQIIHVFDINATHETVEAALLTVEGLRNWWTNDVTGSASAGGTLNFNFAKVFNPVMEVVVSTSSTIEWECISGEPAWAGDRFTFSLEGNEGRIKLTFVQAYSNDISDEQYGRFNYNWGYYLGSLKQYCETGKGVPFAVK